LPSLTSESVSSFKPLALPFAQGLIQNKAGLLWKYLGPQHNGALSAELLLVGK
jgi:hypothetical protein